jgi:hypothetical protein
MGMSYFRRFIYQYFKPDYEPLHIEDYINTMDIPDQYGALKAAFESGWRAAMENKEDDSDHAYEATKRHGW